jgi:HEAT repeat protein
MTLEVMVDMTTISEALKWLADKNPAHRLTAVETLTEWGGKRAVAALMEALNDSNWEVRKEAAKSLGTLGAVKAVGALVETLKDRDELVRVFAAESLGMIGKSEAVPALIGALADSSWLVRGWAATALGDIGDNRALTHLEQALIREKSNFVRLNLWAALFKMGRKETLPLILKLLKSKSYRVRCAVVNTLTEIADESNRIIIIEHFKQALKREETVAVRSSLESALSQLEKVSLPSSVAETGKSRRSGNKQPS